MGALKHTGGGTYTVALSGIKKGGVLTVTVRKNGYEINPASKNVTILRPADTPTINTQPATISCVEGDTVTISVAASRGDGGTLSYQWYSSTTGNSPWTSLGSGARSATYSPPTASVGTTYYYCVVTNTVASNYPTGGQYKSTSSGVGSVVVAAKTWSILLSRAGTQTFTAQYAGYATAPGAISVHISNNGNQATGALTVALSGGYASDFTLSKTDISSIGVGNSLSNAFTVQPKTGLAAGT
jgi:hypothetical protein